MKAPKTRNAGTWTETQFWGGLRSHLRRLWRFQWIPAKQALERVKRPYKGPSRLQKWEYQCEECKAWFIRKSVQIDHVVPCGTLKSFSDVEPFITRMLPEDSNAYQILCKKCHQQKTNEERALRKAA